MCRGRQIQILLDIQLPRRGCVPSCAREQAVVDAVWNIPVGNPQCLSRPSWCWQRILLNKQAVGWRAGTKDIEMQILIGREQSSTIF